MDFFGKMQAFLFYLTNATLLGILCGTKKTCIACYCDDVYRSVLKQESMSEKENQSGG